MKVCPYCGHVNDDQATGCRKCKAGFPHDESSNEQSKSEQVSEKKPSRRSKKDRSE